MASASYAPQAYQEVQVRGADRRRLVVLLFQGLAKFLTRARVAMQEGNHEAKARALSSAQALLSELLCALDDQGEGTGPGNGEGTGPGEAVESALRAPPARAGGGGPPG